MAQYTNIPTQLGFEVDIEISPEMEARIANGEFTQENVLANTVKLFEAAKTKDEVGELVTLYRGLMNEGADIDYYLAPFSTTGGALGFRGILQDVARETNSNGIRAAAICGAMLQGSLANLWEDYLGTLKDPQYAEKEQGYDAEIDSIQALLDYGMAFIGDECEGMRMVESSSQKTPRVYLFDENKQFLAKDLDRTVSAGVEQLVQRLFEKKERAYAVYDRLMAASGADSPLLDAQITPDDLKCLYMMCRHTTPEIQTLLLRDSAMLSDVVKQIDAPIIREAYCDVAREMAAGVATHTIEGPAKEWGVDVLGDQGLRASR